MEREDGLFSRGIKGLSILETGQETFAMHILALSQRNEKPSRVKG